MKSSAVTALPTSRVIRASGSFFFNALKTGVICSRSPIAPGLIIKILVTFCISRSKNVCECEFSMLASTEAPNCRYHVFNHSFTHPRICNDPAGRNRRRPVYPPARMITFIILFLDTLTYSNISVFLKSPYQVLILEERFHKVREHSVYEL